MTIAILATGDEIIHGDTLNTNAHTIAHILSSEGMSLGMHLTCGDRESEITSSLAFLSQSHDIILIIGGLGPTSDDRTRFALASYLKINLIEFSDAITHIQNRLIKGHLQFNSGNRQQALFPADAVLLDNPHGTAMGCYFNPPNGKLFALLPGPPRECLPMFENYLLPALRQTEHSTKQILKWRLFGVPESIIAEKLDSALAHLACTTGYRLDTPYIEFKVRCAPELTPQISEIVDPLVAPHCISSLEQRASERLRMFIEIIGKPIVICDEATGGVLQQLLQTPSSYSWLRFNILDTGHVYFHIEGLTEFWQGEPRGETEIILHYRLKGESGKKTEVHHIPHYSSNVVYYAAEWLSDRIWQLLQ